MALNLDNAQPIEIKNIDNYIITDFKVSIEKQSIEIIYNELSGANVVDKKSIFVMDSGPNTPFTDLVSANPDNTVSFYQNIKNSLYAELKRVLGLEGTIV